MTNLLDGLSLEDLLEAIAGAILLVDNTGQVVHANSDALQLFGYDKSEIVSLKVEALMPLSAREHHQQYRNAYSKEPKKRAMGDGKNLVALTRDGREFPVDIGLSPIQYQGQHLVLVTFHQTDKQIHAEILLQENQEHLHLAKLAAGFGIFDINLQLGTMHCDKIINMLWGLAANETITYERFIEGIHPEDRFRRQSAIQQAAKAGENGEYHLEYRVINLTDGTLHWVLSAGKVFLENGRILRVVGVVQDNTENKLLERKLQERREEAESILKQAVATQTASAIAHELNQPLAAISAYSEVALFAMAAETVDRDRLKRALEGCIAQAQRAGRSLHELLEFLQKGELVTGPIDLNGLVQDALDIAQSHGYSEFHPILQLAPDLPAALGNRIHVQKVLVNLLGNSVEAMRSAGVQAASITIRISTMADLNMVKVTVQDTGPGLSDEVAKRIFEPFFTTKAKGIGMGLTISRGLIEANGGQLWFDPEEKPGATFHFTLPTVKSS